MINSEPELTYGKLFHPLHLGTHHNPNLSRQFNLPFEQHLCSHKTRRLDQIVPPFQEAILNTAQAAARGTCIHASSIRRVIRT